MSVDLFLFVKHILGSCKKKSKLEKFDARGLCHCILYINAFAALNPAV